MYVVIIVCINIGSTLICHSILFDILSSVRTLYSRLPHGGRSLPASFSHSLGAAWPLGERAAEEETDEGKTAAG